MRQNTAYLALSRRQQKLKLLRLGLSGGASITEFTSSESLDHWMMPNYNALQVFIPHICSHIHKPQLGFYWMD